MPSVIEDFEKAQTKYIQEKKYRSRWKSLRASGLDDVCNRRLFYYMTCGELARDNSDELTAVFEEGKEQEAGVRRYLSELGFEIKKATLTNSWDKYGISGAIDGTLNYNGTEYLVEIKTVSETAWDSIREATDLLSSSWHRRWYGQIQLYLFLFEHEQGILFLKRKQAKQVRMIPIAIDYAYAESLLKKAEAINTAVKENAPPEYLVGNVKECKQCTFFGTVCNPPMDYGESLLVDDAELQSKLERRETLKEPYKEYNKLDKEVKERFEGVERVYCGSFVIEGKEQIRKVSAREASESRCWVTKISKLSGETKERALKDERQ